MRGDHREAGIKGGREGGEEQGQGTEGGQTIRGKEDGEEEEGKRSGGEKEFELFDPLCSLFQSVCPVFISIS